MPAKKDITIKDIAEKANVSQSTVSRVLTENARVADKKKAAVLKAMDELNYQPNIFARGLAGGQSLTIGVLTQNFGSPFYDAILRGILPALNGSNYSPLFADGRWRADKEKEALGTLLSRRVDGVIVVGGLSSEETICRFSEEVPLIVVGRNIPDLAGQCLYVDNFQAAANATQFLIRAGHRHIAHIAGILSHQDAYERREGYCYALKDGYPELIIEGDFRRQSGIMAVEMLFTRGQTFSAIFAANDQMAFGARLALYRRGIRVPDDVSIIGFDDQPDSAYMIPPLTTVRQPGTEMGEEAARAILQLIKGDSPHLPVFPTELIIRESVASLG
jgi:LacI family transcriptional regulator